MADEHDKRDCKRGFEVTPLTPLSREGSVAVAHHEDHSFTLGTVVPADPGKVPAGTVLVERQPDGRYVRAPLPGSKAGPANVNSEAYRAGWGRIFGGNKNPEVGQA